MRKSITDFLSDSPPVSCVSTVTVTMPGQITGKGLWGLTVFWLGVEPAEWLWEDSGFGNKIRVLFRKRQREGWILGRQVPESAEK